VAPIARSESAITFGRAGMHTRARTASRQLPPPAPSAYARSPIVLVMAPWNWRLRICATHSSSSWRVSN